MIQVSAALKECRIEKMRVRDGHLQRDCDFDFGIRLVLGKGLLGKNMRLLGPSLPPSLLPPLPPSLSPARYLER